MTWRTTQKHRTRPLLGGEAGRMIAPWVASSTSKKGISPLLIKAQILLARAHFSPGEIDGKPSENLNKAMAAFAEVQGSATGKLDQNLWDNLVSMSKDPVLGRI
jgi:peptidoglycan hydrolase-like protein with peptidoglycan-binding domain